MGTNYYLNRVCHDPCGHCDSLHVGKSSVGWRFLVNADDMGTRSWRSLRKFLKGKKVFDEYEDPITASDLIVLMEQKAGGIKHSNTHYPEWMAPREDSSDGPVDFTEGGFS